jgi:hypothetical protein
MATWSFDDHKAVEISVLPSFRTMRRAGYFWRLDTGVVLTIHLDQALISRVRLWPSYHAPSKYV